MDIPEDVLKCILAFTPPYDLPKLLLVNRELNLIVRKSQHFKNFYKFLTRDCKERDFLEVSNRADVSLYILRGMSTVEKQNELMPCVRGGIVEVVRHIVELGNVAKEDINDVLSIAARCGHLEVLKYLINVGANELGDALDTACYNGHIDIVKYLAEFVDITQHEDSALLCACDCGNLEIVKFLVEHGANPQAQGGEPVLTAFQNRHLEIVKFLVGKGASIVHIDYMHIDTAIHRGHLDVVKYIKSFW